MKKWGLADSAACECGEPEQTADLIIVGEGVPQLLW